MKVEKSQTNATNVTLPLLGETMADEEDGDIEVQAEEEEEVGGNFQDTELELLDGDREGTKWLVINAL
jgi:maltooligosyltrehalose synthase